VLTGNTEIFYRGDLVAWMRKRKVSSIMLCSLDLLKCSICSSHTSEVELALFNGVEVGEGVVYQVCCEPHPAIISSECAEGAASRFAMVGSI